MGADLLRDIARRGPVLAVIAHPDDESFGLGAVLAGLSAAGALVRVLCLTHGEASTLGVAPGRPLGAVRSRELTAAAERLGIASVELRDLPDGGLAGVPVSQLDDAVASSAGDAATFAVFEAGGVTGHPDHCAATASATRVARARGAGLLEWGVAPHVAHRLNEELATSFVALDGDGTVDLVVDRSAQLAAITCHESQARDNPVLARRLAIEGPTERIRYRPFVA
jgi:LmbE family N-acetylglucosaminyl deacetylase